MEQKKRQKQKRILDVKVWQGWRDGVVLKGRRVAKARRPRVKWGVRDEYDGSSDEDSGGDGDRGMLSPEDVQEEEAGSDAEMEVEEDEERGIVVPSRRRRESMSSTDVDDQPAVRRPPRNARAGPSRANAAPKTQTFRKPRNVPKVSFCLTLFAHSYTMTLTCISSP